MVDKDVFRELKTKISEQRHANMITMLEKQIAQYNRALSLSIQINQLQESELLKHQIIAAGYSEGE